MLGDELGLDGDAIAKVLGLAEIRGNDASVVQRVKALGVKSDLLDQGLDELHFVMRELGRYPEGTFVADLSIARGLAYYTGTVYEAKFADFPDFPTVCGGGRYDNLVGDLISKRLPGIGISIGLTRIFAKLMREGRIQARRKAPTDILVVHTQGAPYSVINETAGALRARGLKVEQYHEDRKLKTQLKYAADKGIPWIWFPPAEAGGEHQVKNSATRDQTPADPATWLPE
jgi:histidyl-tRNA synthetase